MVSLRLLSLLLLLALLAACGPAGASVVVEWTTANEVDTAGFNLYRSDSPDGPFIQINSSLIPASTDPLTGGQYEYLDTAVEPGRTYYYQLEDVEYSGDITRHGPLKVTAPGIDTPLAIGLAAVLVLIALGVVAFLSRRRPAARSSPSHTLS